MAEVNVIQEAQDFIARVAAGDVEAISVFARMLADVPQGRIAALQVLELSNLVVRNHQRNGSAFLSWPQPDHPAVRMFLDHGPLNPGARE